MNGSERMAAMGEAAEWSMTDHPDDIPEDYWRINAYTNGHQIVVVGSPPSEEEVEEDEMLMHNCDAMGCNSVGSHVLAYIPLYGPVPALYALKKK